MQKMVESPIPNKTKEEQFALAEEFAEGDVALKECLLFLWQNKIGTIACCAGHEKQMVFGVEGPAAPYILFEIDNFKDSQLKKWLIYFFHIFKDDDILDHLDIGIKRLLVNGSLEGSKDEVRRTVTIYFTKKDETVYKKLLQSFVLSKGCKLSVNELLEEIKLSKVNSKLLKAITALINANFEDYIISKGKEKNNLFNKLEIKYEQRLKQWLIVTDNCNYKEKRAIEFCVKGVKGIDWGSVKEGWVSKSDLGNYYTIINGEIKKLTKEEAKAHPKLNEKTSRYNITTKFSYSFFKSILEEINTKELKVKV